MRLSQSQANAVKSLQVQAIRCSLAPQHPQDLVSTNHLLLANTRVLKGTNCLHNSFLELSLWFPCPHPSCASLSCGSDSFLFMPSLLGIMTTQLNPGDSYDLIPNTNSDSLSSFNILPAWKDEVNVALLCLSPLEHRKSQLSFRVLRLQQIPPIPSQVWLSEGCKPVLPPTAMLVGGGFALKGSREAARVTLGQKHRRRRSSPA